MTSPERSYSAPIRNLSELKKGIRRYDEPALTKEKLSLIKPAKAAMQPTQATTSPYIINNAVAAASTAVAGSSSRLPIPVRTSSIPNKSTSMTPRVYVSHPPLNVDDTWSQNKWSGERRGVTTTVGGSEFQPIQKKKRNKRKTGKAATEWIVTPDDAFSNLPRRQARARPPGANYVDERDSERLAENGGRRNKSGGRGRGSGGSTAGSGGGARGKVMKDYGEDGKGSIYVSIIVSQYRTTLLTWGRMHRWSLMESERGHLSAVEQGERFGDEDMCAWKSAIAFAF